MVIIGKTEVTGKDNILNLVAMVSDVKSLNDIKNKFTFKQTCYKDMFKEKVCKEHPELSDDVERIFPKITIKKQTEKEIEELEKRLEELKAKKELEAKAKAEKDKIKADKIKADKIKADEIRKHLAECENKINVVENNCLKFEKEKEELEKKKAKYENQLKKLGISA